MKKIVYILLATALSVSSCDYLDIVPDERTKPENTYQNPDAAKNYLYSCYSKMYNPRVPGAPDKFSAAEIINAVEKNDWSIFPRGYYSPSSPSLVKAYYDDIWSGIRQCYQFLSVVDMTPDILPEDLQYYKAEATLLIAYYHWLSFRAFGPSVIIKEMLDPFAPIEDYPERSSVDEVVAFIDQKITEAETIGLAERHDGDEYGRFTKSVAQALRAKVYLYAASPLFNGNSEFYADFKSPIDNRNLISQNPDIEKWKKAEQVTRDAISYLESQGFRLYNAPGFDDAGTPSASKPGPVNKYQRAVRYTFMDNVGGTNPEVIMVDTRKEGMYEIQNQSTPKQTASNGYKNSWNSIAPTLQTVEMFYTKNGLPIDEDPNWDYDGRYSIVDMPANYDDNSYGLSSGRRTLSLHLNREPRFFAWISFHNGNYEIAKFNGKVTNSNNAKKAIVVQFRFGDEQGLTEGQTGNYTGTGYLNKKFVHPAFQNGPVHYPYPVIRMAEMYMNLAEILIEEDIMEGTTGRLAEAKSLIDQIRVRAGIPTIDDAWKNAKHPEKATTAEGLREIYRRERQIEFYLENQRFWDLRRWKDAGILGEKVWGMNIHGSTDETFFVPTELQNIRTFKQAQYLMPIPMAETNKVPHVIQNPGY